MSLIEVKRYGVTCGSLTTGILDALESGPKTTQELEAFLKMDRGVKHRLYQLSERGYVKRVKVDNYQAGKTPRWKWVKLEDIPDEWKSDTVMREAPRK